MYLHVYIRTIRIYDLCAGEPVWLRNLFRVSACMLILQMLTYIFPYILVSKSKKIMHIYSLWCPPACQRSSWATNFIVSVMVKKCMPALKDMATCVSLVTWCGDAVAQFVKFLFFITFFFVVQLIFIQLKQLFVILELFVLIFVQLVIVITFILFQLQQLFVIIELFVLILVQFVIVITFILIQLKLILVFLELFVLILVQLVIVITFVVVVVQLLVIIKLILIITFILFKLIKFIIQFIILIQVCALSLGRNIWSYAVLVSYILITFAYTSAPCLWWWACACVWIRRWPCVCVCYLFCCKTMYLPQEHISPHM